MGYTHYWRHETISQGTFNVIKEDFKKLLVIFKERGIELGNESGEGGLPRIMESGILFNGVKDSSHESFVLSTEKDKFSFCKTNLKPYDLAVTCILIICRSRVGCSFVVSSDGESSNWDDSRGLCHEVLGYGNDFTLSEEM